MLNIGNILKVSFEEYNQKNANSFIENTFVIPINVYVLDDKKSIIITSYRPLVKLYIFNIKYLA